MCKGNNIYICRGSYRLSISYYSIHSHFTGKILSVTNSLVCKRKYVACPGWERMARGGDERGWVSREARRKV